MRYRAKPIQREKYNALSLPDLVWVRCAALALKLIPFGKSPEVDQAFITLHRLLREAGQEDDELQHDLQEFGISPREAQIEIYTLVEYLTKEERENEDE